MSLVEEVRITRAVREKFERYVDRSGGPDACHLWTGGTCLNRRGVRYGKVRVGAAIFAAHRLAVKIAGRRLRPDQQVLHACDEPLCCNPRHLRCGSQSANMRDARDKGRLHATRGAGGRFA